MSKKPLHEIVAEKLIIALKQGSAPWQKPWVAGSSGLPMNPITENRYKGGNAIHLMTQGYSDSRWMTYKQAMTRDAQVRKGEKGTLIQYWKFIEEVKRMDESGKPVKVEIKLERPRLFSATVFNAEQIDGLPAIEKKIIDWDAITRAETILKASGASIFHGEQDRAFYRMSTDSIHLPNKEQFPLAQNYYATALHELGHWTGHDSRLNRDLNHPFGSEGYAKEELRAEIASMILGDALGIGSDPTQHAAYVGSWIEILENEPLEIFRAAADAEKIQNYVIALEQKQVQEQIISPQDVPLTETISMNETFEIKDATPEGTLVIPALIDELPLLNTLNSDDSTGDLEVTTALNEQHIAIEKVWLNVPFRQKEMAKDAAGTLPDGRKAIAWDKESSRWFAHSGADLQKLTPWILSEPEVIASPENTVSENTAFEKTWLAIPYEQRDMVKQLAGKLEDGSKAIEWDKAQKCWFANSGANLDTLKPWLITTSTQRQEPALMPDVEFADTLRSVGCLVFENHPIMDGNTHRISVDSDKKGEKSGFYVGHLDGHQAGYVKNNRTGIEIKWKSKGYSLTDTQKANLKAEVLVKQQTRAADIRKLQEEAALRVAKKLSGLLAIVKSTPYLTQKGISSQSGIFTDKDGLKTYIPMMDAQGKQWTMQVIQEDGTKRFAKNSRKEGCFHVIGGLESLKNETALIIAEGYATAATISDALGIPTVVAFDAGNLLPVANALREAFPDKVLVIAGDDDKKLEREKGINPGKNQAIAAATAADGIAIFPIFAPDEQEANNLTDYNDLATKSALGLDGVKRQVQSMVDDVVQKHALRLEKTRQEELSITPQKLKIRA
jgi:antirestriction protein ArdC/phage/plasmid primase-like uncharacterized protein